MITEKNIDLMLGDVDKFLNITQDSKSVDIEKIAQNQKEKKIRELKGNSRLFLSFFFLMIGVFGLNPNLINFINILILSTAIGIISWLQSKSKKELNKIDLAQTFNDYHEQRKKLALISLNLFKNFRIVIYSMNLLFTGFNVYHYLQSPSLLSFIVYFTTTVAGFYISVRAMESSIKEYRGISQS